VPERLYTRPNNTIHSAPNIKSQTVSCSAEPEHPAEDQDLATGSVAAAVEAAIVEDLATALPGAAAALAAIASAAVAAAATIQHQETALRSSLTCLAAAVVAVAAATVAPVVAGWMAVVVAAGVAAVCG